jgi:hypothetical protein
LQSAARDYHNLSNPSINKLTESLSTGAKQVASATIPNESFKLIDALASEGAWAQTTSFQTSKLIVISKTSLHFREDCGMFCEGEWEQKRRFDGPDSIIGLVGFVGLIDIGGLDIIGQHTGIDLVGHHTGIGPIDCTSPNGLNLVIGHVSLIDCIGLNGHIGRNGLIDHMGFVGRILDSNGLIGLISLVGFGIISFVSLISLISLVSLSLNGLIGQIGFIGLGISFIGVTISTHGYL